MMLVVCQGRPVLSVKLTIVEMPYEYSRTVLILDWLAHIVRMNDGSVLKTSLDAKVRKQWKTAVAMS